MMNRMSWMAAAALAIAPLTASAQQPAQDNLPGVQPGAMQINLPGPINSPQDLLETARMLFVLADANNDGQISKQEAIDAGNLMVGGLFFRADANGDGAVSKEEAQAVRDRMLQQQPVLRFVLDRAMRDNTPEGVEAPQGTIDPEMVNQMVWSAMDTNNDGQIQATEVRQAVQTGVDALFTAADTNRDDQLSPAELNASMYGAIEAGLQASFQAADLDNSGSLSKEEFAQAIVQPAYTVFDILDRDLDGQLTPEELQMAARIAIQQIEKLTVDVPRNSPVNILGSGGGPAVNVPARQPGQPGAAPRQPGQPGAAPRQPGQPGAAPGQPGTPR